MTPLDRFLDQFPGAKELILRLDEYLPLIVVGAIMLVIAAAFCWTFAAVPRKAARLLKGLARQGYGPLDPSDAQLAEALDRLTPIYFHTYELSTVTDATRWRVKSAVARYDSGASRYCALISRGVSRRARARTKIEHQLTNVFLERRHLALEQDVYATGDGYELDPGYGLRRVPDERLGRLAPNYIIHTRDGTLGTLPGTLEDALVESAPFLCIKASTIGRSDPYLFHARLRFTPEGWGLISSEFVYHPRKMSRFTEVVDRISAALV